MKLEPVPFGAQVGADPRENPRWSEEEGRILTLEEWEEKVWKEERGKEKA